MRVPEVRLIGADGEQLGVYITAKAFQLAQEQGLDLVEISPQAKPPVCKIMDYGKHRYEKTKKLKEQKKHQTIVQLKELKFRPNTDEHDFQFKFRNVKKFLEEGNKVKVTVRYRGREMAHKERGLKIIERITEGLKDEAQREIEPKMEGRTMMSIFAPLKLKKKG